MIIYIRRSDWSSITSFVAIITIIAIIAIIAISDDSLGDRAKTVRNTNRRLKTDSENL